MPITRTQDLPVSAITLSLQPHKNRAHPRSIPSPLQKILGLGTVRSTKPVPTDSYIAEALLRWRRQSDYASDDDFVYASETMKGKQPYWPDNLMKQHIRPVANTNGIDKNIGSRCRKASRLH